MGGRDLVNSWLSTRGLAACAVERPDATGHDYGSRPTVTTTGRDQRSRPRVTTVQRLYIYDKVPRGTTAEMFCAYLNLSGVVDTVVVAVLLAHDDKVFVTPTRLLSAQPRKVLD